MRVYVPVSPEQIDRFAHDGAIRFPTAFALTPLYSKANLGADEEEMEFELSCLAAQESRETLGRSDGYGFALAVDIGESQKGEEFAQTVDLVSDLQWSQVESVLVAESAELELTWYATQEVVTQLPLWLVKILN